MFALYFPNIVTLFLHSVISLLLLLYTLFIHVLHVDPCWKRDPSSSSSWGFSSISHPNQRSKDRGYVIQISETLWGKFVLSHRRPLNETVFRQLWVNMYLLSHDKNNTYNFCVTSVDFSVGWATFLPSWVFLWCKLNQASRKEDVFVSSWKVSIVINVLAQYVYKVLYCQLHLCIFVWIPNRQSVHYWL